MLYEVITRKLKKGRQDAIKDVGGFVGGHLREGRRKNGNVLCRSLITLDMDYGKENMCDDLLSKLQYKLLVYSSYNFV